MFSDDGKFCIYTAQDPVTSHMWSTEHLKCGNVTEAWNFKFYVLIHLCKIM